MSAHSDKSSYTPAAARPDRLIRHATFRQLQIFESIYRLGSFTRAAEELFLTQPTVSMQLKKLSDAIEMPLFEHVGRRVEPTDAGNELYRATRQVFDVLANVEMKLADLQGLKSGRLRLGVITTAKYLAPEILGAFSRVYPGIELALKVTNRERIIERMQSNDDDLYIMGQAPTDDLDVKSIEFAPNPLVVMAPRDHHLVGKKNLTLKDIAAEPLIIREPGSGIRDTLLKMFSEQKLRPNIKMELGSNEAIKHAIVGGLGISIMSLHTLRLEGPEGPVALLDVKEFPLMRSWYLVYPRGKELSLASEAFLEFIIDQKEKVCKELHDQWPALNLKV